MYSKAKIAGHPIHPMLVGFPIALYTATVVCLIAYGGTGNPFWFHVASVASIAAVVMACAAAVPGLIDMLALPERSRARSTALVHMGFNLFTLAAFAIVAIVLAHDWRAAGPLHFGWPLVLGLFGLASVAAAGAMGFRLVQTHHVGIKPTTYPTAMRTIDETDDLDELPYGAMKTTETETERRATLH